MENAVHIKNGVLAAIAAVGTFVAHALGGWDAALKILVALMAADYITGVLVAGLWKKSNKSASGTLDSRAGFKGLCKKGVILGMVWIASLLDVAMGANYVRTAVVLFFVGNEGLSLLENMGLMGVPFPTFFKKALEALRDKGDTGDDSTRMEE
ncbi:MAG: phage holin family protein [Pseudoflavonifractor sp.]